MGNSNGRSSDKVWNVVTEREEMKRLFFKNGGLIERVAESAEVLSCAICLDTVEVPYVSCDKNHAIHRVCYDDLILKRNNMCVYQCGTPYRNWNVANKKSSPSRSRPVTRSSLFITHFPTYQEVMEAIDNQTLDAVTKYPIGNCRISPAQTLLQIFCAYRIFYCYFSLHDNCHMPSFMTCITDTSFRALCALQLYTEDAQREFLTCLIKNGANIVLNTYNNRGGANNYIAIYAFLEQDDALSQCLPPHCRLAHLFRLVSQQHLRDSDLPSVVRAIERERNFVNTTNQEGDTLLHCAEHHEVIAALNRCGANPNIENAQGKTPLYSKRRTTQAAAALIRGGAKWCDNRELRVEWNDVNDMNEVVLHSHEFFGGMSDDAKQEFLRELLSRNENVDVAAITFESLYGVEFLPQYTNRDIDLFLRLHHNRSEFASRFVVEEGNKAWRLKVVSEVVIRMRGDVTREVEVVDKMMSEDIDWNEEVMRLGYSNIPVVCAVIHATNNTTTPLSVLSPLFTKYPARTLSPRNVQFLVERNTSSATILRFLFELPSSTFDTFVVAHTTASAIVMKELLETVVWPLESVPDMMMYLAKNDPDKFVVLFNRFRDTFGLLSNVKGIMDVIAVHKRRDVVEHVASSLEPQYRLLLFEKYQLHEYVKQRDVANASREVRDDVVNTANYFDETPLYIAIYNRDPAMVSMLLEHGADANAPCKGTVPLHHAFVFFHADVIARLIEGGADVARIDAYKKSYLHYALLNKHAETVRLLLEKGLKPTVADVHSTHDITLIKLLSEKL